MLFIVVSATIWSAVDPADYATWFFELFIGAIGICLLVAASYRIEFTPLMYGTAALHYVILAAGAKYTYAEMPLFDWLRESVDLSRNHFDRVGHFAQGFTPALLTRELLLRATPLPRGMWVTILSISVAVAFSACYEILEWLWVVAFYPGRGPEWLGMQGDPWDAQADMLMALAGGVTAAVGCAGLHDRFLAGCEPIHGRDSTTRTTP
jgi:putative membrane protein